MPRTRRRRSSVAVTCPACGSDKAQVVQRLEKIHEPDVQGDFRDEITVCDSCSEEVFTFEQAEAHSRAYAAAVARARKTMSPERIYDLRLTLGWSQAEMEGAFGVGPKTWGRWERGTVAPSGPASRLLWIAENERPLFLRMVDSHRYKPQRSAKVVGTIAQQGIGVPAVGFAVSKPVSRITGRSGNGSTLPNEGESV